MAFLSFLCYQLKILIDSIGLKKRNEMENFDFILENVRFHLYEKNTIIFFGWYRDDNPDGRYLKVYLDEEELDIQYENKKGIPIRQKYLNYKANISEEINGIVKLPKDWETSSKLRIYCFNEEKRVLIKAFNTHKLKKMQASISCYIENIQVVDGNLVISGWGVADGEISYDLLNLKNKAIPSELNRNYRRDVMEVFQEAPKDYVAGFKIIAEIKGLKSGKLILRCGKKVSVLRFSGKNHKVIQKKVNTLINAWNYYQKYGFLATIMKTKSKLLGLKQADEYNVWRKRYAPKKEELEEQRNIEFEYRPKFSIIVPLYCTREKYLRELIDSILQQTYINWELCLADGSANKKEGKQSPLKAVLEEYTQKDSRIKYRILEENKGISENTNAAIEMATGEYIVLADHDDRMSLDALFECAKVLNQEKEIDVIYSDEDKIDMQGKKYFDPHFKSDFNIDLLCSMNYICHLFVVKKELLSQTGVFQSEYDGAQDYDFILRCCEDAKKIYHIPKILYHWRCHLDSTASNPESKMYAFEAGRKAVEEHYKRLGIPAIVEHGQFYGMYRTKYQWKEQPLISILIPNKDHIEDLKKCMDSINEKSTYRNYEFIVIENNSVEQKTFDYYKKIENTENISILYYKGEFNYSKINNFGAKYAKGDYLLLLNNDTEIINSDCLSEMLGYCMREDVGIVGARLYYEDDTIQHAGVVLGFGGIAGHTFIGLSRFDKGYFSRIICAQNYSAVTAACLMTKKKIYEQVGGLTEEFQVAFNDIDYCMKVRRIGKLIVYNPAVELYHYESKSRGLEDTPEKVERFNSEVARFIEYWKDELEAGDPYYNPNLSLDKSDFSLCGF